MTELRIRIVVLIVANQGKVIPNHVLSRCDAPHSHMVVAPGSAAAFVISRSEKYAANNAAKNISSLASQMMVPTETASGRPLTPWRRLGAIGCRAP